MSNLLNFNIMKTNKVLDNSGLHNRGIDLKDCKFCVYNWENGCPSDQSKCWCCYHMSEFLRVKK